MRYGSVCSGIEAASIAWEPLGWQPAWFAEIEAFPSAVLATHWPHVANLGDMTKIAAAVRSGEVEAPEVVAGGTPCQSYSIGGKRKGLSDPRGQLTLSYVELANAIDSKRRGKGEQEAIFVWENVPGVFSSKDNAFGYFLAGMAGETEAFEPGPRPATGCSSKYWRWNKKASKHIPVWSKRGVVIGRQRRVAWRTFDAQYFGLAQRRPRILLIASARTDIDPAKILFEPDSVRRINPPSKQTPVPVCLTARGAGSLDDRETYIVTPERRIRHLMPIENERQMGFPDNHTLISWRGKDAADCPDGPRYKAIGNSMAVPVMRWIGERIAALLPASKSSTRVIKPQVVSFSGGRTSAYLVYLMEQRRKAGEDVYFTFMDTGAEHPATYQFIRDLVSNWNIPLVCLRVVVNPVLGKGNSYRIVPVDEIGPDLQPMRDICEKYGTPYVHGAFCTRTMKMEVFERYCRDTFGDYHTWIGIRADEPKRLKPRAGVSYLAEISDFEKQDVISWWKNNRLIWVFLSTWATVCFALKKG